MTYSLTLNKSVFCTYHVPVWMPGTEQLRTADKRVIIGALLALCHSTQKTGKISYKYTYNTNYYVVNITYK